MQIKDRRKYQFLFLKVTPFYPFVSKVYKITLWQIASFFKNLVKHFNKFIAKVWLVFSPSPFCKNQKPQKNYCTDDTQLYKI